MKSPAGLEVIKAKSLRERTSIGIGGCPVAEVRVNDERALAALPELLASLGGRPAVFGRGTNILAADRELPITLVTPPPGPPRGEAPSIAGREDDLTLVRAKAGVSLPQVLAFAAANGLAGMSGLAGIPGSLGGAVFMNAGSFGAETGRMVHSIEVFSPKRGLVRVPAADIEFSYRKCAIKGLGNDGGRQNSPCGCAERGHPGDSWFMIVSATLALAGGREPSIREHMRECLHKKSSSQPIAERTAGCVFKNPAPDAPAGMLIDRAGLKGKGAGGMRFSEVHANFLVNDGSGSFDQAMELIELAREKVLAQSGHSLELEVRVWQ